MGVLVALIFITALVSKPCDNKNTINLKLLAFYYNSFLKNYCEGFVNNEENNSFLASSVREDTGYVGAIKLTNLA